MRVLEPHHFKHRKKKRKNIAGPVLLGLAVIVVVCAGAYWLLAVKEHSKKNDTSAQPPKNVPVVTAKKIDATTKLKTFSGNQFRDLYRSVMQSYPNTEAFTPAPNITGNIEADAHIRELAEARGFRLTRIPVTALIKTNEPRLNDQSDDLLQPAAFNAWQQLKEAAKKDGVPLQLNSAYRSPEWQRDLFMERLLARGVTVNQVINGQADDAINATFSVTAVPGYSRHHTGYTVDFWCEDGVGNFDNSVCFDWLNAKNYEHAKQFGWIPSYPPGADEQGPEPESWEYVWVGKDLLYE